MTNPVLRFLLVALIVASGFVALHWLEVHFTVVIENRLIQNLGEAVSGDG